MLKQSKFSSKWSFYSLALSLFLVGCSRKIEVSVTNGSQHSLKSVDVVAQGQTLSLGAIAPGEEKTTEFKPQQDSAVKLNFINPESEERTSEDIVYIEAGFRGRVEVKIDKDFKVHTTDGLKIGP